MIRGWCEEDDVELIFDQKFLGAPAEVLDQKNTEYKALLDVAQK